MQPKDHACFRVCVKDFGFFSKHNRKLLNHFRQVDDLEQFTFYKDHSVSLVKNGQTGSESRNWKSLKLLEAFVV